MKLLMLFLLTIGFTVFTQQALTATVQEQDEDVRGAFLTTRPKNTNKNLSSSSGKPIRRRPRPTPSPLANATPKPKKPVPAPTPGPTIREQKLGMGLTLFMRDSNGLSVRVDPSREFHQNERVRLLLETNVDGYLYVFNTTDGGAPMMIYPDPDLDEGGNYIQAHVPAEVPSSLASEERLRWFRFDSTPGVERLYFVFTREPLSGVPLESDLIGFCREKPTNCPMRPPDDLWSLVQKESSAQIQTNKTADIGGTQTEVEQQATARGIGLNRDDPEPSLIMMSASTSSNTLVATLELLHK
jgi:uncharacterized protein DUF4384